MAHAVGNFGPTFYQALKEAGYVLPDNVADVRLLIPVDGIYQLHFEVNLTDEDLMSIGKALIAIAARKQ